MTNKPSTNTGCAWLFVFGLITFISLIVVHTFSGLPFIFSTGISLLIAITLNQRIMGTTKMSAMFRNVLLVFVMVIGARLLLLSLLHSLQDSLKEDQGFRTEEGVEKSFILEEGDSVSVYASFRVWKDNYGRDYQGPLMVREKDYNRLYNYLDRYRPASNGNFWGNLYAYADKTDGPSLDLVLHAFEEIQSQNQLNQMEFAEMLISCIQDIPYSFVFQDECRPPEQYEESIRELLEECPECCIGNKAFGLQTPVGFIQNLKGDCDTRTVLIYSLLKYFGYDVAILNSDFYRHSIIGLNIPAKGTYKTFGGKKYMVWETTAKYFTIGQLPTNFSDITHWNVVLTSK